MGGLRRFGLWMALWLCALGAACDQTRPIVDTVPEEGGGSSTSSTSSSGAGGQGGAAGALGGGGTGG